MKSGKSIEDILRQQAEQRQLQIKRQQDIEKSIFEQREQQRHILKYQVVK